MPSELQLIRLGRLSTIISMLSSVLFLISADKSEQIQLCKIHGETPPQSNPSPAEIVLAALLIGILSNYISYQIAKTRLDALEKESHTSDKEIPLQPNVLIVTGILLAIIGGILSSTGALQKIQQEETIILI